MLSKTYLARCCTLAAVLAAALPAAAHADFASSENWTSSAFYGDLGTAIADVSGDGKADAVAVKLGSVDVRRANSASTAFDTSTAWTSGAFYGDRGTRFADVDGDGDADALAINNDRIAVRLSNGSSFGAASSWTTGAFYGSRDTYVADVTGDKRADAIAVNTDGILVRPSNGSSFNAATNWSNGAFYGDRATAFAELTGDGRADAIAVNNDRIAIRQSTGSGFGPASSWTASAYYGDRETVFADVTGDTVADAIAVGNDKITARPSTGSGFGTSTAWTSGPFYGDRGTQFADANGDLVADAIAVNNDRIVVRLAPFADSFERTAFPASPWNGGNALIDGNASVQRVVPGGFSPTAGGAVMMAELTSSGTRAELLCFWNQYRCDGPEGTERVYEFDFRVPSGYTLQPDPNRASSIMQTKSNGVATPDEDDHEDCYSGGLNIKPVSGNSGSFTMSFESRSGAIFANSTGHCDTTGRKSYALGTFTKDTWHRFKLHARWSTDPGVGFVEVWVDGTKLAGREYRATLLDGEGRKQWFRIGPYDSANTTTWRVYYDNVIMYKP